MNRTLVKLWAIVTLFVAMTVSVIWYFQVQRIESEYYALRQETILEQTKIISEVMSQSDAMSNIPETVKVRIELLGSQHNTQIYFTDSDDHFINPRIYLPNKRPLPALVINEFRDRQGLTNIRDRILSRSKDSPTIGEYNATQPNGKLMLITYPVFINDMYSGKVVAVSQTPPIDSATNIIKNQLTTISFVLFFIGSLLALLLSGLITIPIQKIKQATRQIGQGNYDINISIKSSDELGQLARDIESMAEQLGQKDKLTKEFVSSVSHDLKTPITLIQTYAEFMRETSTKLSQSEHENLKVIQDESVRLDNIVDDLLYLSRIDSGALDLNCDYIDLKELVDLSIRSLQHVLDDLMVNVSVYEIGERRPAYLDVNQMRRVLINLIQNALYHAGEIKEVLIQIKFEHDIFRIEVIDLGVGIPEDVIERVWDRFYRVDQARQNTGGSAGIGMSIVKSILEKHSFKYGLKSRLGVGTTVWFEGELK